MQVYKYIFYIPLTITQIESILFSFGDHRNELETAIDIFARTLHRCGFKNKKIAKQKLECDLFTLMLKSELKSKM